MEQIYNIHCWAWNINSACRKYPERILKQKIKSKRNRWKNYLQRRWNETIILQQNSKISKTQIWFYNAEKKLNYTWAFAGVSWLKILFGKCIT